MMVMMMSWVVNLRSGLRMIWIGIARVECGYSDIGWIGIAF
jgi:hypothetical protein